MNQRITTVVWREEDGSIDPIVMVSAEKTQTVDTVDTLYERVVRAITTWMKTTEEGRKAWEYAGDDFNVGDLTSELGDEDLLLTATESKEDTQNKIARLWAKFQEGDCSGSFVEWLLSQGVNIEPLDILDVDANDKDTGE